jgi:hypothetical protein
MTCTYFPYNLTIATRLASVLHQRNQTYAICSSNTRYRSPCSAYIASHLIIGTILAIFSPYSPRRIEAVPRKHQKLMTFLPI